MAITTDPSFAKPYIQKDGEAVLFRQIEQLIAAILALEVEENLKKRMLGHALWEKTVGTGNFKGRFRSESVVENARNGVKVKIQRDHVFLRKVLIDRLQRKENIEKVLDDCVTCTVTVEEHQRLHENENSVGWQRYDHAKVRVMDMTRISEFTPIPTS